MANETSDTAVFNWQNWPAAVTLITAVTFLCAMLGEQIRLLRMGFLNALTYYTFQDYVSTTANGAVAIWIGLAAFLGWWMYPLPSSPRHMLDREFQTSTPLRNLSKPVIVMGVLVATASGLYMTYIEKSAVFIILVPFISALCGWPVAIASRHSVGSFRRRIWLMVSLGMMPVVLTCVYGVVAGRKDIMCPRAVSFENTEGQHLTGALISNLSSGLVYRSWTQQDVLQFVPSSQMRRMQLTKHKC